MAPVQNSSPNDPRPLTKPHGGVFYVLLATALFVFFETFSVLAPIVLSLLLTILLSLALNPAIARLRRWTGGRRRATALIVLAFAMIVGLTGWAFFGPMSTTVTKLVDKFPAYWERLQKPLIKMEQQAVLSEEKLQVEVRTEIAQEAKAEGQTKAEPSIIFTPRIAKASVPLTTPVAVPVKAKEPVSIRSTLSEMIQGVIGRFTNVAFNTAQMLIVFVTVVFGVIFTLLNPHPVFGALFSLVPECHHNKAITIAHRIAAFVPGWAGSTLLGMLTIGVLVFLLMWPIFGFMDALVLGLIAGMFEAIPFVGPTLSAVPALLLALSNSGMTTLLVLMAYVSIQALENNIILPYIMSRGMKLHPVAVIFSMLLCVVIFGVLGVLIAAPMLAIVDILHDELYRKRFLATTTDGDLDRMARIALREELPK
ncbi:MAG: AI-2E family transporter [Verrucomicrobiota bacterium]|nr:AI-2E family transporter [Verrucomicrobiota bacterium]